MSAEVFRTTFRAEPGGVWSAPGRVNLIGEHTDYNDGLVLPFAIGARTSVAATRRPDDLLRMRSAQQPAGDVAVRLSEVTPGEPAGWGSYVAGILWAARRSGHDVGGMDLVVDGRVPLGSGLSSSHALECAVAMSVNDLFDLGLGTRELALLTQLAENEFVGAPTGIMDQLVSLAGIEGHALYLDTRTLESRQVPFDPEAADLALVVIDTRVHHSVGDGSYANRRAACERAAKELGVASLRDVPPEDLDEQLAGLPPELLRRARHVVTEIDRVTHAVRALEAGDWAGLGRLMTASHESLRDDYEVSCPELDAAVASALASGALGARMTGAGFGGSAIALVPSNRVMLLTDAVKASFAARAWRRPAVFPVAPSSGARRDA